MDLAMLPITLIFAFVNISVVHSNWIIERIPERRYGPIALAQSNQPPDDTMVSGRFWRNSVKQRPVEKYKSSANTVRTQIDKANRKQKKQENAKKVISKVTSEQQTASSPGRYSRVQRCYSHTSHVSWRQAVCTSSIYINFVNEQPSYLICDVVKSFPPNSEIPCGLNPKQTPMLVYFSFDDATTSWNIEFYRRLFAQGRNNPNGCPIRATFFNSHENTQYDLLKELYDLGHEVASHSVSHKGPSTWWSSNATMQDWIDEIVGQKRNIHRMTKQLGAQGIPLADIRGMRAPFLAIGGDTQFQMLEENDFVYDSSIPNNNKDPSWPFTLHDPSLMNGPICRGPYCPSKPHSVWEVVMNVYYLDEPGSSLPCSMIDGCRPGGDQKGAHDFLKKNFLRHYEHKNKVPFGINMHAAWFAFDGYINGMDDFIQELLTYDDVYILPIIDVLEWMQNPHSLEFMASSSIGCKK